MATITVTCWDGSTAEADTPEAALFAARTLWDEAVSLSIPAGCNTGYPVISFYVDGNHVRSTTSLIELNA